MLKRLREIGRRQIMNKMFKTQLGKEKIKDPSKSISNRIKTLEEIIERLCG